MPNKTNIEYGDYVSNPIKFRMREDLGTRRAGRVGQACVKVEPECVHCWAEGMNKRFWTGLGFTQENMAKVEPFLDDVEMDSLARSKAISGKRVLVEFCSDLFGEWVEQKWLDELFELFDHRRDVTWILLTKRADRMSTFIQVWQLGYPGGGSHAVPLPNVWLGGTIGTQKSANARMPHLAWLGLQGWHTWISCEPLLEFVNLYRATPPADFAWDEINADQDDDGEPEEFIEECEAECDWVNYGTELVENPEHIEWERSRRLRAGRLTFGEAIDLVVAGGESGWGARVTDPEAVRSLLDQCAEAEVGFYFKQWGEWGPDCGQVADLSNYPMHVFKRPGGKSEMVFQFGKKLAGQVLDGQTYEEWPDA